MLYIIGGLLALFAIYIIGSRLFVGSSIESNDAIGQRSHDPVKGGW